jgi:hypothetical protein
MCVHFKLVNIMSYDRLEHKIYFWLSEVYGCPHDVNNKYQSANLCHKIRVRSISGYWQPEFTTKLFTHSLRILTSMDQFFIWRFAFTTRLLKRWIVSNKMWYLIYFNFTYIASYLVLLVPLWKQWDSHPWPTHSKTAYHGKYGSAYNKTLLCCDRAQSRQRQEVFSQTRIF